MGPPVAQSSLTPPWVLSVSDLKLRLTTVLSNRVSVQTPTHESVMTLYLTYSTRARVTACVGIVWVHVCG